MAGSAKVAGLFYGSAAGNAVADQYYQQAMDNSVSGQVLAAGGSLEQANAAAQVLGLTLNSELMLTGVGGNEALLNAYAEGVYSPITFAVQTLAFNASVGANSNAMGQVLQYGSIDNMADIGWSAGLGMGGGVVIGGFGAFSEAAPELVNGWAFQVLRSLDYPGNPIARELYCDLLSAMKGGLDAMPLLLVGDDMTVDLARDYLSERLSQNSQEGSCINKTSREGGI